MLLAEQYRLILHYILGLKYLEFLYNIQLRYHQISLKKRRLAMVALSWDHLFDFLQKLNLQKMKI